MNNIKGQKLNLMQKCNVDIHWMTYYFHAIKSTFDDARETLQVQTIIPYFKI